MKGGREKGGSLWGCGTGLTWVSRDEGAVEADNRRVWVDEDGFLFTGAGIEEFEEWGEARIAEVEALVIREKDGTGGSKTRAGILDFFDAGPIQVIDLSLVIILAEVVLTLLERRVRGQLRRKRIA